MLQLVIVLVTILYSPFSSSFAIFGVMIITQATEARFLFLNSTLCIVDTHPLKHFAFPYTMFSITYFALSKIRSPLIWKEWSIIILFFHLLLYPLLTRLQLSGIRLLSQSISSMFLMTPNDCFQISICDNFKTSLQVVFFKVWYTVILSQVHGIDVILPNLWDKSDNCSKTFAFLYFIDLKPSSCSMYNPSPTSWSIFRSLKDSS